MDEQTIDLMFPNKATHWTLYVDPATSLILTALILYTTLGLLRGKYTYQVNIDKAFILKPSVPSPNKPAQRESR